MTNLGSGKLGWLLIPAGIIAAVVFLNVQGEPRAVSVPMEPTSAYEWNSDELKAKYGELYAVAEKICGTPGPPVRSQTKYFSELRMEYLALTEDIPGTPPTVPPTPERIGISC